MPTQKTVWIFLVNLTLSHALWTHSLTSREVTLINHVQKSIKNAEQGFSKLSTDVLDIPGMTSHKTKHFLNNICSLPNSCYLEIGVWKGATFTAALYNNENAIQHAVAIDNWSEFAGPYQEFQKNCNEFIATLNYQFYTHDCFNIHKKQLFNSPVDIYFYDGNHTAEAQEKAFTYFNEILAPTFIAIVDDWNHPPVARGTKKAFKKLNYTVLAEHILPARFNGDTSLWWNGLYIAIVRRNNGNN